MVRSLPSSLAVSTQVAFSPTLSRHRAILPSKYLPPLLPSAREQTAAKLILSSSGSRYYLLERLALHCGDMEHPLREHGAGRHLL